MPLIIRSSRSKIHINGGKTKAHADSLSAHEILLNKLQDRVENPYGQRFDAFTFHYAFEYLKRKNPRTMFISFDETDQHGHGGRYDEYLRSAHRTDQMIAELWDWLQTQEQYKDKTTLIITTDHGRGKGAKGSWKKHNRLGPGANQIWLAVIGPDTPPIGEVKVAGKYYQKQIPKTAAALLGLDYKNVQPVGQVITGIIPLYNQPVQYGNSK
jgi:phosphoglycerol transferase MdoB-like AlkP superfamily enzyme